MSSINSLVFSSLFHKNQASSSGGAIYYVRSSLNETLLLVDTELSSNNAAYGGALYVSDYNVNQADLLNNLLYGNSAYDYGSNIVQPPLSLTVSLNRG